MWARASGLSFIRNQYGAVDIEIRFESYYHGDEDSFDGPGGVVAHAFFPEFGGDAHFDNGEDWTVNKYSVSNNNNHLHFCQDIIFLRE